MNTDTQTKQIERTWTARTKETETGENRLKGLRQNKADIKYINRTKRIEKVLTIDTKQIYRACASTKKTDLKHVNRPRQKRCNGPSCIDETVDSFNSLPLLNTSRGLSRQQSTSISYWTSLKVSFAATNTEHLPSLLQ